ncbi:probable crossover junction endonuclease EME2 isoform X4 [Choloepus didactylus]|uniref:probable crossover junction endonuclease EME2 isoform X4 n=1 Tax=Choloepus didactylus TaxID=27675 RepID=UPI00189D27C4|nr:probable crossover junction endonuclease EME2 isoform X4 [Choloepus didactylus]
MAGAGPGRAGGSFRGQGRGRGREQRRPPTWEISDSDAEGPVRAEAAARAPDPAEERRAAAEALRLLRPERALRRLAVRVDPAILQDAGADTLMEALGALGCEYLIEPQPQARSLRWSRVRPDPCPRGVPPEVWAENEQEVLLLLEPGEFLRGIARLPKVPGPGCSVPWICPESPARPHLAIIGLDAYLWSQQAGVQGTQWQQESPAAPGAKGAFSWSQVEEALVLLQLWAELDVLLVASWRELSEHVCAFTRALAQRPYKRYQESQAFSFCTAGRWAAGERVARDGTGLWRAWCRQIGQFNRVSTAMAEAVAAAFPSPRLLQQALAACSTEQEQQALLVDLPVAARGGTRPRRMGPDLSRRLCLFLTATNPDLLLDLGS